MFKRTRYQHGSVELEERKKGPAVWVYRWWEEDINGKLLHRKLQIGDVETYPNESAAHAAADALRLTINTGSKHKSLQRTTISILWEHYSREELPRKALSTQGFVHARLLQYVRKELDCAPLGKYAVGPDQDSRGRAVAAGNRSRKWNPGQNQVCDVGFVFPCGSLGVLWPQPDLLRPFR